MNQFIRKVNSGLKLAGFDLLKFICFIIQIPRFISDLLRFSSLKSINENIPLGRITPCMGDISDESGTASGDYFYQDLWAAQRIFAENPVRHLDIGSRIDGFVAHVASFRQIEVLDIRPLTSKAKNICFRQLDISSPLRNNEIESCCSLSSLNVLEHIGLGRYGDPLDPEGHLRAWDNIHSIIAPGGTFYFSVPIGPLRVEFNAHRVFSIDYLLKMIEGKYQVIEFSYVDDSGDFIENADVNSQEANSNFGCTFGCGLFILRRI